MDGKLPGGTFEEVLALTCDGCKAVAAFMREALLEHTKRLAAARGGGL